VGKLLVTMLLALKALSMTEWELAASLAAWAMNAIHLLPSHTSFKRVTASKLKWTAHTIIGR
jgi:hypothetical protein